MEEVYQLILKSYWPNWDVVETYQLVPKYDHFETSKGRTKWYLKDTDQSEMF